MLYYLVLLTLICKFRKDFSLQWFIHVSTQRFVYLLQIVSLHLSFKKTELSSSAFFLQRRDFVEVQNKRDTEIELINWTVRPRQIKKNSLTKQ